MKQLKIQNDERLIIVDDEDYDRLSNLDWFVWKSSSSERVVNRVYFNSSKDSKVIPIANIIMHNESAVYDHADRNPFNNQKSNLREATHSQNMANRNKFMGLKTTSKYKGVHWYRRGHKWRAQITFQKKVIYLGNFKLEEDAARAYDKAALECFKEFANINFK